MADRPTPTPESIPALLRELAGHLEDVADHGDLFYVGDLIPRARAAADAMREPTDAEILAAHLDAISRPDMLPGSRPNEDPRSYQCRLDVAKSREALARFGGITQQQDGTRVMDFIDYQKLAYEFAGYPPIGGHSEVYPALGLANEAGEVLGKIKKVYRDKGGEYSAETLLSVESELGDVLWYVACLATELGLSLELVACHNIAKLKDRQSRGKLLGDGDNR